MKRLFRIGQIALLAALVTLPLAATAQRNNDLQWRLGSDHRGSGYQIYYRYGRDDWRRAPGSAIDMGDGWVIGTDRRNGGYGVYRWTGYSWQRMPGAGVEIGGSFLNPWIINDRGERFHWTGVGWREDRSYRGRDNRGRRNDDSWDRDRNDRDDRDDRGDWDRDDRGDRDNDREERGGRDR